MKIVFEGIDGVGKTTLSKKLTLALIGYGFRVLWTKRPFFSNTGSFESMLNDGREHLRLLSPFLRDFIIIQDRGFFSGLIYQTDTEGKVALFSRYQNLMRSLEFTDAKCTLSETLPDLVVFLHPSNISLLQKVALSRGEEWNLAIKESTERKVSRYSELYEAMHEIQTTASESQEPWKKTKVLRLEVDGTEENSIFNLEQILTSLLLNPLSLSPDHVLSSILASNELMQRLFSQKQDSVLSERSLSIYRNYRESIQRLLLSCSLSDLSALFNQQNFFHAALAALQQETPQKRQLSQTHVSDPPMSKSKIQVSWAELQASPSEEPLFCNLSDLAFLAEKKPSDLQEATPKNEREPKQLQPTPPPLGKPETKRTQEKRGLEDAETRTDASLLQSTKEPVIPFSEAVLMNHYALLEASMTLASPAFFEQEAKAILTGCNFLLLTPEKQKPVFRFGILLPELLHLPWYFLSKRPRFFSRITIESFNVYTQDDTPSVPLHRPIGPFSTRSPIQHPDSEGSGLIRLFPEMSDSEILWLKQTIPSLALDTPSFLLVGRLGPPSSNPLLNPIEPKSLENSGSFMQSPHPLLHLKTFASFEAEFARFVCLLRDHLQQNSLASFASWQTAKRMLLLQDATTKTRDLFDFLSEDRRETKAYEKRFSESAQEHRHPSAFPFGPFYREEAEEQERLEPESLKSRLLQAIEACFFLLLKEDDDQEPCRCSS